MKRTLIRIAIALALAVVAPLFAGTGFAGPEGEEGKGDAPAAKEAPKGPTPEEVAEFLKEFDKDLKKMTDEDAIAGVEKLKAWFIASPGEAGEDIRKDIVKSFAKIVKLRGRDAVVEAAAGALGDFGEDGSGLLRFVVASAMNQKVPPTGIVRTGLKSLGKVASPSQGDVKFLTDLLKKDDEFIADVAQALGGYKGAPGLVRRDIFEELVKMSEGVYSKSEANDPTGKRRWNIWGTEVVEAMQQLTKQNFTKPTEFRKWLNDKDEGGGKNPRTWADPEPEK